MKRQISSALKQRRSPVQRLKSAVQFRVDSIQQKTPSAHSNTRIQTRILTGTTNQTVYKTISTREDEMLKTQSSDLYQTNIPINKSDNYFFKPLQLVSKSSQKIVVTADNIQTSEIQRRIKFDPLVRQQVQKLKTKQIKNLAQQKFVTFLIYKEKQFLDYVKFKQTPLLSDLIQDLIEYAIGTQISLILVEILLLGAQSLENIGCIELSIHLYNQTRLLANNSKQTFDIQKMQSFLGLANGAIYYEQYQNAIRFLKKCLQYAWLNNNSDIENKAYQKLGLCYFYMGNIEKAQFYHERNLTYDYEIEESPLRQLSNDTLKNFLNKYYSRNYAEFLNNALLSKLHLQFPICLEDCITRFDNLVDYSNFSPRIQSSSQESRNISINNLAYSLSDLKIDGQRLIKDILSQKEFDFEVYTPKHSFRSESKCFDHLRKKKIHPQDIYHDPKYKHNPFVLDDLGVIKSSLIDQVEKLNKYKLPLNKQIEIRLQDKCEINLSEKMKSIIGSHKKQIQMKNKILLTHKNSENSKKVKLLEDNLKQKTCAKQYQDLLQKLIG